MNRNLTHPASVPGHERLTQVDLGDGVVTADCSCGGIYSIPAASPDAAAALAGALSIDGKHC